MNIHRDIHEFASQPDGVTKKSLLASFLRFLATYSVRPRATREVGKEAREASSRRMVISPVNAPLRQRPHGVLRQWWPPAAAEDHEGRLILRSRYTVTEA